MNLFNIIEEIENVDPEVYGRISERRDVIKNITSFGSKVALAAMPFAVGAIFKKAYAQSSSTPSVVAILNYALTLEYLESTFYNAGAAKGTALIPGAAATNYFNQVTRDENNHVTFLKAVITSLGATPVSAPQFDLTAGNGSGAGPFADVLTNYSTFLAVAQVFEDTGVRAYKGQAENILANKAAAEGVKAGLYQTVLTAALSIHAVEARHASAIRSIRGLTPWITSTSTLGNDTGIALVNANFDGEQNVTQGGVDVTTLKSVAGSTTSVSIATAAFDEPLSMTQVLAILVGSFIVNK
ncbi:ferritin-like domain-containing protein [Mucilaginibacter lappiensis]|uniref:Rubrerythrin n=1 Tax=Mucilaginibacter lappiensis TaxID=354630 RepID=A0A1N6SX80_9SPHI|nr:ferritin-like domain-containing protein [Mucilaginibacter lappiensis]MBB6108250.1 rubrerythrin [Mucilaginibacter lappiensis]MBB6129877.1 rubrerythrin [Mucilaginibacter lappiensis]SIQ45607.1 Ferritin-like domain-containing protein [Mucilaginibacter lappiensis]